MTDGRLGDYTAQEKRSADPGRLTTLTDGVFAIILTILVLELRVPDLDSGESLREALVESGPTFIAFVVSFLLGGMYWVWHRKAFAQVRYIDRITIWLNMLFLLPIATIPFAASVLGEFPSNPTALQFYGIVFIVATLLRLVLDQYIYRHVGLLWQPPTEESRRLEARLVAAPLIVYSIAVGVAAWLPVLSLVLYFALPLGYFALVVYLKSDPRTRVTANDLA